MKSNKHTHNVYTRNMSLTALLLALIGMTCLVFASDKHKNFDGIYVGAAAGGLETFGDLDTALATTTSVSTNGGDKTASAAYDNVGPLGADNTGADFYNEADDIDANVHKSSGIGAIRLGYGKSLFDRPIWLGIEIFGNFADREVEDHSGGTTSNVVTDPVGDTITTTTSVNSETEVTLNDAEFGIDIRPGILLTQTTLLYGRIGAAFNELELDTDASKLTNVESNNSGGGGCPLPPPFCAAEGHLAVDANDSDDVVGLRLGVGLEQKLTPNFSITADYIFTDYGDISAENGRSEPVNYDSFFGTSQLVAASEADVTTQAVLLGFNYYPKMKKFHKPEYLDK